MPSLVPDDEKEDWEAIEKKNKEQEQELIESDTKKFNESTVISFKLSTPAAFNVVKVYKIYYKYFMYFNKFIYLFFNLKNIN